MNGFGGRVGSRIGVRLAVVALVVGVAGWAIGSAVIRSAAGSAVRDEAQQVGRGVAERVANELDTRVGGLSEALNLLTSRAELLALSPDAATELAVAIRAVPAFDELVLRDDQGRAVAAAAANRLLSPAGIAPRDDIPGTLFEGTPSVTIVADGANEIEIVVPVESPPGTTIGSLTGRVPLDLVAQALQIRLLGETARVVITAADGQVLAHPERDRVIRGERYPLAELSAGPDRVATIDRDGVDVIAAAAVPRDFPGIVIVEEEEDSALARVDDELGQLTLLVALLVGATVLAVLVLGNRLVRPLAGLVRTLRRLGEGDRTARAEVTGSAEFRAVASEVNRMADSLDEQITALEAAHREIHAAEERFRAAFEEAPVAMALAQPDETLVEVNPPMAQLLGRTVDDLESIRLTDVSVAEDRATSLAALDRALRTGSRMYRTERSYAHPDGTRVPTLTNVAVVRDSDGEPSYLIVHAVDLSELRAAEERFRQIIESSPDVIAIVALDGTIEMVNRRVADAFGYEPEDLVGKSVEILVPQQLRDAHVAHREHFASEPRTRDMGAGLELSGRRSDGTEFPIEVSLSPIDVDGSTKVIAAVRDVSERRRGQVAARELREMQIAQRQAMEINDNIIQGLTIARWSFDLDQVAEARHAVERTLDAAQALIDRMLSASGEIQPGSLQRERPAEFPQ